MWPEWLTIDFWKALWTDFVEYMQDLPIIVLKAFLEAVLKILGTLPVPEFVTQYRLSDVMSDAMPYIGYFLALSGVSNALAMIASAVVFRLMRKAITLGRW